MSKYTNGKQNNTQKNTWFFNLLAYKTNFKYHIFRKPRTVICLLSPWGSLCLEDSCYFKMYYFPRASILFNISYFNFIALFYYEIMFCIIMYLYIYLSSEGHTYCTDSGILIISKYLRIILDFCGINAPTGCQVVGKICTDCGWLFPRPGCRLMGLRSDLDSFFFFFSCLYHMNCDWDLDWGASEIRYSHVCKKFKFRHHKPKLYGLITKISMWIYVDIF